MNQSERRLRHKVQSTAICCLAVLSVPALACSASIVINNIRLWNFADNLFRYPLPQRTFVVDRKSEIDRVGQTGNACSYKAELTLVSELRKEEIEAYYKGVALPAVGGFTIDVKGTEKRRVFVSFDDKLSTDGRLGVIVELYDEEFTGWSEADIRCFQ